MDIGRIGVEFGLASAIAAVVLYVLSLKGNRKVLLAARTAYGLTALSAIFCFGRLMWLVVHHQFQYKYVYHYSSPDLGSGPTWNDKFFLYAATWAGQEGSFLLWLLWTGIIGGLLIWKAGKWESRVMPIYASVPAFLFGILVWLNPYIIMTRADLPNYPTEFPWPPNFGEGLNPSLQNYWMAIHPPTIFFGFSSLAVPFAYAIAAMIWREYEVWAPRVMPWVLMTVATLGVGLMMGGYWAYETQGWHGFWGWDPVENASLFPWLGAAGLLHGLVVQKSRGGMGRTNLFLAIVSWLLFLYGTFLTRSGVMAQFSVHSFVSLDNAALYVLIAMIAIYGVGGIALLATRWRAIPGRPISDKALSRDTAMVMGIALFLCACAIVAFGTSFPMLAQWFGGLKGLRIFDIDPDPEKKGAALLPIFYNKIGSVLLIPTLLLMGIVPLLAWGKTNAEKFVFKVLAPWFAAIAGGFLILVFVLMELRTGWRPPVYDGLSERVPAGIGFEPNTPRMLVVAIGTCGLFCAISNLMIAIKLLRVKAITMGGWLAHVGIGLLFVGTVLTNVYEKTENVPLIEGEGPVKTAFGYSLEFTGWTHDGKTEEEIEKDWRRFDHGIILKVVPFDSNVARADDSKGASPDSFDARVSVFKYISNDGLKTMVWPYIHKEWGRDSYISLATEPEQALPSAKLRPGMTQPLTYLGAENTTYMVTYKRFYMNGGPGQPGTVMGAELELVNHDGKKYTCKPGIMVGGAQGPEPVNLKVSGLDGAGVMLRGGVDPATKQIEVVFLLPEYGQKTFVTAAVTNKPFINLVWLGVILMGVGTLIAMVRRSFEARKGTLLTVAASAGVMDVPIPVSEVPLASNGNGTKAVDVGRSGKAKVKVKGR